MNRIDPEVLQQLCAWMDGELPPDQARFLERRLAGDVALRRQWERWQLASACVRGQPVRPVGAGLAVAVAVAVAAERRPRGRWAWGGAAVAALLALAMLPRWTGQDTGPAALVSRTEPAEETVRSGRDPIFVASPDAPSDRVSPVAAPVSVRDFPLADSAGRKPWPRSPLAPDAQAMDAYLVRHNTLMAEDGLGGFMPYVDVVAQAGEGVTPGTTDEPAEPRP